QEAGTVDEGHTAAKVPSGRTVHAGHDHASFASGGDDRADSVAYGEQGSAVAGGANQQLAVGRNKVYAAVAGGSGRIRFHGDAGNAGHGYVAPTDGTYARNADSGADEG